MRADRLLRLLTLLQRHRRAKAAWLAEQLDVSERTVFRDMEALSSAGVPVYTERGRAGGCVLLDGFTTEASGLTVGEAQALFTWVARETATEIGLGVELSGALAKIAASAPSAVVTSAEAMREVVVADRRSWFGARENVEALPDLRRALERGRRVKLTYRSAESATARSRTIDPIGLVDNAGRWYLVAEHRGRPHTYRVSRVASVETLAALSRVRTSGTVQEIWDGLRSSLEGAQEPTEIVVAVAPQHAGRMRRMLSMQVAPGTTIEEEPSPDGQVRWRLAVRQADVVCGMAVASAPELTVLEPADLRRAVLLAARRAAAHYAEPGESSADQA